MCRTFRSTRNGTIVNNDKLQDRQLTGEPNFHGLEWLITEVESSLSDARHFLTRYAEHQQEDQLQLCLDHIHQVTGSLLMAQCHGGALLSEEMELLVGACLEGDVVADKAVIELLGRASLELPDYLRQCIHKGFDQPAFLIKVLNDLRATRRVPLASLSPFFRPNLAIISGPQSVNRSKVAPHEEALKEFTDKLGQLYQYALLSLTRGDDEATNVRKLNKILFRLKEVTAGSKLEWLWLVAAGVLEGVASGGLARGRAINSLLWELGGLVRKLSNQGLRACEDSYPENLLKNLLYYVATADSSLPRLVQLRETFKLEQALPAGALVSVVGGLVPGFDRQVIVELVRALGDELDEVKTRIDSLVREGRSLEEVGERIPPILKRVADTLAMAGQPKLRKSVTDLSERIQTCDWQSPTLAERELTELATSVLGIETALQSWASHYRPGGVMEDLVAESRYLNDQAHLSLVREMRNNLEAIKDSIIGFISSQWDRNYLQDIPALVKSIHGAMSVVRMKRPARIIAGLGTYIHQELITTVSAPEWERLDQLADVITGLEHFLEVVSFDTELELQEPLGKAENALGVLGYFAQDDTVMTVVRDLEPLRVSTQAELEDGHADLDGQSIAETWVQESLDPDTPLAIEGEVGGEDTMKTGIVNEGDKDDEVDDELREIFVEEAREILTNLGSSYPGWLAHRDDAGALAQVRRGFHSLKGSGRMVGARLIGELSYAAEHMFNRVIDGKLKLDGEGEAIVGRALQLLPGMVDDFSRRRQSQDELAIESLIEAIQAYMDGGQSAAVVDFLPGATEPAPQEKQDTQPDIPAHAEIEETATGTEIVETQKPLTPEETSVLLDSAGQGRYHPELIEETPSEGVECVREPIPPDSISERMEPAVDDFEHSLIEHDDTADDELTEIFREEARAYLEELKGLFALLEAPSENMHEDATRMLTVFHSLKGSARLIEQQTLAELAQGLERLVKKIARAVVVLDEPVRAAIKEGLDAIDAEIEHISDDSAYPRHGSLLERIALLAETRADKPEAPGFSALKRMLANGLELILDSGDLLAAWRQCPRLTGAQPAGLLVELRELLAAAESAGMGDMSRLAGSYADALEAVIDNRAAWTDAVCSRFGAASDTLLAMIDAFVADQVSDCDAQSLIEALNGISGSAGISEIGIEDKGREQPLVAATGDAGGQEPIPESVPATDDLDPDILAIFADEAEELLEQIEHAIQSWRENPVSDEQHEALVRELHTFKGGARVAGLTRLGTLSHEFETYIENWARQNTKPSEVFFEDLLAGYDALATQLERDKAVLARIAQAPDPKDADSPLISEPGRKPDTELIDPELDELAARVSLPVTEIHRAQPEQETGLSLVAEPGSEPPRAAQPVSTLIPASVGSPSMPAAPIETQEMVRISATAIDELVNLAAESSITRGRIEQNIQDFGRSLDEMEATIIRLQGQVAQMDRETQAQIAYRREQIELSDEFEDFDPLEMDRYSQFRHLFSALQESAADLRDVRETLLGDVKSAELSLAQQAQVNADLQENLLQTRLVPFNRLVPRLRRVARQAAADLNKKVSLQFDNTEGDLDRNVLNKIMGPLEHMLRNAIDHGLEDSETRLRQGKPAEGKIALNFGRESSEITIRMVDDGKGIDTEAVRKRAVSRGLILDNAGLTDAELLQLIFLPGFSTSETVSQVSGRGVGLDVVVNEVRDLGGTVSVSSRMGAGAEFSIRVPFTLSVNRALMVRDGGERYALPLNTIAGVVQVTHSELEAYKAEEAKSLYYGNQAYRICELRDLLNMAKPETWHAPTGKASLVLVATENTRYAVQVDALEGSHEIAIKNLGSVFNHIRGLSGLTIMGDGRVVVILDLVALLRSQGGLEFTGPSGRVLPLERAQSRLAAGEASLETVDGHAKTVMVVDDSVTVRKVTSRFLEREGFEVVTAKDGVEAMDLLNDLRPDLLLLDIEMPRMDGFDVARNVRNSAELSSLPIIMISSRSGAKHRERASACGVNHFLGKPYQEEELLSLITDTMGL